MNKWKIGAYLRLSSDDGDKLESNSISNQKELIRQFAKREIGINIMEYYIDDGYSGTDFNRPDFQRMVEDIKEEKINAVIVKDLSRFGRNYIAVGQYIEEIFPTYNIRFISINDNIDSYKDPSSLNSIIVPFKNLMNDEYARDISNKVKSVLNSKKSNGEFIGSEVPYGYLRDPNDKHKFIIDKVASKVVKKIFKMILDGNSKAEIAKSLNLLGILPPKAYKMQNKSEFAEIPITVRTWDNKKIDKILKNRVYIGDLVQNKVKRISYKVHKLVYNSIENLIIVKNHHEAIIKEEDFDKAQKILFEKDLRTNKNGEYDLFGGFLKCGECQSQMTVINGKKKQYYYCREYIRNRSCTNHSIEKNTLENIVSKLINMQINLVMEIDEKIAEIVSEKNINYDLVILNERLKEISKSIEKYEKLIEEVDKDFNENLISNEEYINYKNEYQKSLLTVKEEKMRIISMIEKNKMPKNKEWINKFVLNKGFDKLNRKILNDLIEGIYIYDNNSIVIKFNYESEYFEAIDFLKEHNCDIMMKQNEAV